MSEFLRDFEQNRPSAKNKQIGSRPSTSKPVAPALRPSREEVEQVPSQWSKDVSVLGIQLPAPLFWLSVLAVVGGFGSKIYSKSQSKKKTAANPDDTHVPFITNMNTSTHDEKNLSHTQLAEAQRIRKRALAPLNVSLPPVTVEKMEELAALRKKQQREEVNAQAEEGKLADLSLQFHARQFDTQKQYQEYIRVYQEELTKRTRLLEEAEHEKKATESELADAKEKLALLAAEAPEEDEEKEEEQEETAQTEEQVEEEEEATVEQCEDDVETELYDIEEDDAQEDQEQEQEQDDTDETASTNDTFNPIAHMQV